MGIQTLGGEAPKSILTKREETVPTEVQRSKVCVLYPDVPSLQTGMISLLNTHFLLGSNVFAPHQKKIKNSFNHSCIRRIYTDSNICYLSFSDSVVNMRKPRDTEYES